MTEDIRIFSYLPNPRVWKSLITAKLAKVEIKVIGDKPRNLPEWLWDFDAKKLEEIDTEELEKYKRQSKRGFKGDLFKTDEFLDKNTFCITEPIDGNEAHPGNGNTVAFKVPDEETGNKWHAVGLEHGGISIVI